MTPYPQKPPLSDDERKTLLREAPIARLASVNPDGTIHIVALWFAYVDGDLIFGTQDMTNKVRNVRLDPRVTVLVDVEEPELRGVLIHGRAELDYDDVLAKRVAVLDGPRKVHAREDARGLATTLAGNWAPVVIRVRPERVTSYDYAKDGWAQIGSAGAR